MASKPQSVIAQPSAKAPFHSFMADATSWARKNPYLLGGAGALLGGLWGRNTGHKQWGNVLLGLGLLGLGAGVFRRLSRGNGSVGEQMMSLAQLQKQIDQEQSKLWRQAYASDNDKPATLGEAALFPVMFLAFDAGHMGLRKMPGLWKALKARLFS